MSDDLIDRLRGWGSFAADGSDLREAAADEIDRLRATIAALLAVPQGFSVADGVSLWTLDQVRDRMAAVVEGER